MSFDMHFLCCARIAELEALSESLALSLSEVYWGRAQAEARLAAVIAAIDGPHCNCDGYDENAINATGCYVSDALRAVRAAALGETP